MALTRRPPRHGLAVTRWFAAPFVPGQPGVYERNIPLAPYSYWTGAHWCHSAQTADRAEAFRLIKSIDQHAPWRGLAADPAAAKPRQGAA